MAATSPQDHARPERPSSLPDFYGFVASQSSADSITAELQVHPNGKPVVEFSVSPQLHAALNGAT